MLLLPMAEKEGKPDMEKTLYECVLKAIQEVGIENFKKTSLFLSNEKVIKQLEKAA